MPAYATTAEGVVVAKTLVAHRLQLLIELNIWCALMPMRRTRSEWFMCGARTQFCITNTKYKNVSGHVREAHNRGECRRRSRGWGRVGVFLKNYTYPRNEGAI